VRPLDDPFIIIGGTFGERIDIAGTLVPREHV
jgi:hypothetical protein